MLEDPTMIRFVAMPIVASVLGIRDGNLDAKAGSKPFDYTMKSMIQATTVPFFVMTSVNILTQAHSGPGVNILEAVGMGGLCAGILYNLARNLSNRWYFSGFYPRSINDEITRPLFREHW